MDLLQIGSQCSHSSCDQIDFLPILCHCSKYFCRHHITPDRHSCPIDLAQGGPTTVPFHDIQRCAINTCSKPSLNVSNSNDSDLKNVCTQCRKSFCAVHRHPSSHSCQVVDAPKSQRSASARALLAKNFPISSRKKAAPQRTINIPTEPIKLAHHRKAELIRMRHRAAPGNPVDNSHTPQDQRLHLRLQIDEQTEKVFWFRKTTVTGKVLDCLASHVESAGSPPLRLFKVQDRGCVLRNDRAIVDNIEDGELLAIAGLE